MAKNFRRLSEKDGEKRGWQKRGGDNFLKKTRGGENGGGGNIFKFWGVAKKKLA